MGVDEGVVDVDDDEVMEKLPEHLVHEGLQYGGWVRKDIKHNAIFIVSCRCYELSFPLVVGVPQVQLSEDVSFPQLLRGGWDQRKWIA